MARTLTLFPPLPPFPGPTTQPPAQPGPLRRSHWRPACRARPRPANMALVLVAERGRYCLRALQRQ